MRAEPARTRAPEQSSSSEVRPLIMKAARGNVTAAVSTHATSNRTDFHKDGCLTVSEVKILLEQREQAADNQCVGSACLHAYHLVHQQAEVWVPLRRRVYKKTLDYVNNFARFTTRDGCGAVRK